MITRSPMDSRATRVENLPVPEIFLRFPSAGPDSLLMGGHLDNYKSGTGDYANLVPRNEG